MQYLRDDQLEEQRQVAAECSPLYLTTFFKFGYLSIYLQ